MANESNDCFLCKKGFLLKTVDGVKKCVKIEVASCKTMISGTFAQYQTSIPFNENLPLPIYFEAFDLNYGCGECEDPENFILANYDHTKNTDLSELFCINKEVFIETDPNYTLRVIPNCKNYKYDSTNNEYLCHEC